MYRLTTTAVLHTGEVEVDTRHLPTEDAALDLVNTFLDSIDRCVVKHADCTIEKVEEQPS